MSRAKRTSGNTAEGSLAVIIQNCGKDAQLLLSRHPAFMSKDIETLSRTSPEYQRHVLNRVRAGHLKPLDKTAACALVYETVSFREVISRMERALGAVRGEAAVIATRSNCGVAELDRGPDRLLTLALVVETAQDLATGISMLPNIEGVKILPRQTCKEKLEPGQGSPSRLNAASALGLLTKNAFNVPMLKPEHLPTSKEQRRALDLCEDIVTLARQALRSAHKKWGKLEARLRVRPLGTENRRVITHEDPDGVALAAAWLAERYLFAGEAVEILFVPRERVLGCFGPGDCLVDVGNTFDPAHNLFDHKPPALASRHDSCAAKLVWDHLLACGKPVGHLEELVLAVFARDSVMRRKEFAQQVTASKRNGFHAAVDAGKNLGLNNAALYWHLRRWLDRKHPQTSKEQEGAWPGPTNALTSPRSG